MQVYLLNVIDREENEKMFTFVFENLEELEKARKIIEQCEKDFYNELIDYSLYEYILEKIEEYKIKIIKNEEYNIYIY